MTVVKICGLRRIEDVRAAATVGADILGFTFYPGSTRAITPEEAAGMIAAFRAENGPLPLICGLFVNADRETIHRTVARCGLDLVQLSGDETPDDVARLGLPLLMTVRSRPGEEVDALRARIDAFHAAARSLPPGPLGQPLIPLLDAHVPGHYGGTGRTGDWALASALSEQDSSGPPPHGERGSNGAPGMRRVILAGGLTPENVAGAVGTVRPWGVDVASGVEAPGQPGMKDHGRIRAFIRAARAPVEVGHAGT